MEWNDKICTIIDYVEETLQQREDVIDANVVARIAGCSFSFFQKVFSYMNNISFAEYIRYRKLTLAGYDLKSTSMKVVDISYKYGYDSPTSFTKAFASFHGFTPKEARASDKQLRVYPKMQLHVTQEYRWHIEERPAFRLLGVSLDVSQDSKATTIPAFWNTCQRNGDYAKLIALKEGKHTGLFALFLNDATRYAIMTISDKPLPVGFEEFLMPASTWAIFDCLGSPPQAIQKGWKYLEEEWLLKYPFRHGNCPELEWYSDANPFDANYQSQIWIPIQKES